MASRATAFDLNPQFQKRKIELWSYHCQNYIGHLYCTFSTFNTITTQSINEKCQMYQNVITVINDLELSHFHCFKQNWMAMSVDLGTIKLFYNSKGSPRESEYHLTISYHLYFLCISKVSSMLRHGSVGRVYSKECYFIFKYAF